jgi:N-acylglucosamine 2-epimerase
VKTDLTNASNRAALASFYRDTLLADVLPFWLRHGLDHAHGGILTCLDRDGSVVDTDKSVWFQGRAAWMFARTAQTGGVSAGMREDCLSAAQSCLAFLRSHCASADGKLFFTVTREGRPLRMRRYVYSEAFAAIASAAYAQAAGDGQAAAEAIVFFETYLRYSFTPGVMQPKFEPTRPMKGIGAHMIGIATAQELRACLGDVSVGGRSCTEWINFSIAEIERDFLKPAHRALLECVSPDGGVIDHHEGRTLNPGHALECAWFVMHEGALRGEQRLVELGVTILDWMWARGWDKQHGGLLYFVDLFDKPVQEYWHDMKFWWPHNEAVIASLLAWKLTDEPRFADMHRLVHDWSFQHFADKEQGEWFGYLHRDGRLSSSAKGTLYKGPFHLPRMLWYCWQQLEDTQSKDPLSNRGSNA